MKEDICPHPKYQLRVWRRVSGWRGETLSDLKDAEERLDRLISEISGETTEEQVRSMWRAYIEIEKSILFIRVEIGEENPGRFVKFRKYFVPDERQALQFALRNLKKGSQGFILGDFKGSLRDLRESRSYIRATLRAKRRFRARSTRASPAR